MAWLEDAVRQARSLDEVEHRPWPANPRPWIMGQTWSSLLFAHWRVDHDLLRRHVPDPLELEQYDGSAWLGLTPFRIEGLRLRGIPPAPLLSSFDELNCRTYVRRGDRPGIWFFSLDASSLVAVEAARRMYKLPYRHARITMVGETFTAERVDDDARFRASYHGVGEVQVAQPGTLEHFLTERYCLYSGAGHFRADIHHAPWPLQRADANVESTSVTPVRAEGEPLLHYSARQDVVIWPLEAVTD